MLGPVGNVALDADRVMIVTLKCGASVSRDLRM
jgi:hypothetical protein